MYTYVSIYSNAQYLIIIYLFYTRHTHMDMLCVHVHHDMQLNFHTLYPITPHSEFVVELI
jgi:hypothetical protein